MKFSGFLLIIVLLSVVLISGCAQTGKVITEPTATQPGDVVISEKQPVNQPTVFVSKVIDGDTIELEDKIKVRLLGINTPEKGQPYNQEATEKLRQLVEGKSVELEQDVNDKDQYGRLLRHVYIDGVSVNLQLVREGYANVYVVPPNKKYEAELNAAWKECLKDKLNLCSPSDEYCGNRCIGISNLKSNAEGDDCSNLNGEYVVFRNSCSYPCELTEWTVKDNANHIYTFQNFALGAEESVTLYTGEGIDTGTKLYWRSSGKQCNAVWNNDKDTLYLRNSNGELVLNYPYTGFQ